MKAAIIGNNVRRHPTRRIEFCPVTVKRNSADLEGYLTDLSPKGARIRLSRGQVTSPGFSLGESLELEIRTPYGASSCSGRIVWAEESNAGYSLGLKITALVNDPRDPIRCLLDSAVA